jgi:Tfp pilus assembly protein FimT
MTGSTARANHVIVYVLLGTVFLLLAGVALATFRGARETQRAQDRAAQLTAELSAAGLRAPSTEQIVRVLGDDGGAVCADPGDALRRGAFYGLLTNGAGGPGARPVIVDNRVVQGQLIIMKVYCPQYLERFQEVVDDLKFADVAEG